MAEREWAGRTIDLDLNAGSGGWHAEPSVPYSGVRRRGRVRGFLIGIALPIMAAVMFVAGAVIGLPGSGNAQPSTWRSMPPGHDPAELGDAVATGGEAGLTLYSCRAPLGDFEQIGRYRRDFGGCHVGVGGKEAEVKPFEILTADWQNGGEGPRPLIAGQTTAAGGDINNPELIFPCRASYQNGLHPGYVTAHSGGCNIGYGGKTVTSQNYAVLQSASWLTWSAAVPQSLPDSALIGGQEGGEPLFICRAPDAHGLLSGKLRKSALGCSIASDGHELVVKQFEVLVPRWTVSAGGGVPVGAMPVGRDPAGLLYLCRGQNHGMLQPGRLNESLHGCHVGMQGGEAILQDYEVLTQ